MSDVLYIDTPAALAELVGRLRGRDWLALDTEFIRERSYFPQLCLLQVADGEINACIDPIALPDLDPLLELLFEPGLLKVFHAGSQDLELLFHLTGRVPAPVFDTQLAATLAGFGDQVGYARLVQSLLGVELDKAHTRADWSRRPLSPAEIAYAADDVRYLCAVYQKLRERLQQQNRLGWLESDFAALSDAKRYQNPPESAWERIGGAHKLRSGQLKVLQTLAAWREEQARRHNRPRRWIIADEPLLDLARLQPATVAEMERVRGLPPGLLQKHGAALLEVIRTGRQAPSAPERAEGRRLTEEQQPLLDLLQAVVQARAQEQAISAATLAGRRELERLILGERELPVLQGWRRGAAGEALLAALEGRLALAVENGRVRTRPV